MTKKQLTKVIKIIRADANCTGELHKGGDKFCVIGGLLFAAGEPKKNLLNRSNPTQKQFDLLKKRYGLDPSQVGDLMNVNDDFDETPLRRKVLVDGARGFAAYEDE